MIRIPSSKWNYQTSIILILLVWRRSLSLIHSLRSFSHQPSSSRNHLQLSRTDESPGRLLIHWKGESTEGYSMQFRHIEFFGALNAVSNIKLRMSDLCFANALDYTGNISMPEVKLLRFNEAMQYLDFDTPGALSRREVEAATLRCSLVHAVYEVVAETKNDYEQLSQIALDSGTFRDMARNGESHDGTWCVRVRHYGAAATSDKERRYGARTRSISLEKKALIALEPLLQTFGGNVDLKEPYCKIYIFDGLVNHTKILARRLALGPQISTISPNTRICVTNTPLCPIASYTLCNVAGIAPNSRILDPFAGSCSILLAAAMIEPTCKLVGIEIAHNGLVNRDDIRKDFESRNLKKPVALLKGDSLDVSVRRAARDAVGDQPFDFIVTDPPYGIRESKLSTTPVDDLLRIISVDRAAGRPILKEGGKMVCFVPCTPTEDIWSALPSEDQLRKAGMKIEIIREQPLNEMLSRWLVSFKSVE